MVMTGYVCRLCNRPNLILVDETPVRFPYLLVCPNPDCRITYPIKHNPLNPKATISLDKKMISSRGISTKAPKRFLYSDFMIEINARKKSARYLPRQ